MRQIIWVEDEDKIQFLKDIVSLTSTLFYKAPICSFPLGPHYDIVS